MAGLLQRYACRMGSARAVGCCESGAMLIEFALIFPILLVLFLGTIEFGDALTVNRKLTNAASAVSDLVAQVAEISAPELTDIARAAEEIVKPYASAQMTMVVTSVETDGSGATTVGWSFAQGSGAVARQTGESFGTLPSGLDVRNSSVIVTEVFYQFTPSVGMFITGPIQLSGQAFFRPRLTNVVLFRD